MNPIKNPYGGGKISIPNIGPKIKFKKKNISKCFDICHDENIGNYGYIGTSILRIYWIYQRYIDEYFGKKYR